MPKDDKSILFVTIDYDLGIVYRQPWSENVGGQVINHVHEEIKFNGPYYRTSDPKKAAFLRKTGTFGTRIFEQVIPDDLVQVGSSAARRYVCSYPNCEYAAATRDGIKAHKKDKHTKRSKPVVVATKKKTKVSINDDVVGA